MNTSVLSQLRDLPLEMIRGFVSSSLKPGCRIEATGRAFQLCGSRHTVPVTSTTLHALAVALVTAVNGSRDLSYPELWSLANGRSVDELTPANRRRYADTVRDDWSQMVLACDPLPPEKVWQMPSSSERIPLSILFPPFDRARALHAMHKLVPPRLEIDFDGQAMPAISLEMLEPGEWKVVGHGRSPEPIGKIAINHDMHLSRQAFEIKLEGGALHVRAMPNVTNPVVHRGQPAQLFVIHNGDEFRVGKLTFRLQGAMGESDTATPRYAGQPRNELE